jgi:fucose permease
MNVFYGIGAIVGPILVSVSLGIWQTALPAMISVPLLLILLLPVTRGLHKGHSELLARANEDNPQGVETTKQGSLYRSPLLWLMSALMMVYVGTEVGIGGWISTYTLRTSPISAEAAALIASGFYLALTAGRLVSAALGTRMRSEQILLVSLLGAIAGGAGILLGVGNMVLTISAVLLPGAAFGPIYPTVLAVTAARFSQNTGKAAALVMAVGSIGGLILPWLFGILLVGLGAQSLALVVNVLIALMLVVFILSGIAARKLDRVSVPTGERVA